MNIEERRQWVLNDEGLYLAQQASGLSVQKFVEQEKAQIDAAIGNVTSGKKPAHYLAYDGRRPKSRIEIVHDFKEGQ